jgi:hypothetical protein
MNDQIAARPVLRLVFTTALLAAIVAALTLVTFPSHAAIFDDHDAARLAEINEAIQSFEDEVGTTLHHLPRDDAEQIESYSYVKLNLEAAHERLNNVFMLVAVSIYMEAISDQLLILNVMHEELLPRSKSYLNEKKDAIASMALAHPSNQVFAAYSERAAAVLGDRAVSLLDDLYGKIGALKQ